ncbi:MAG: hypothetical protein R3B06_15925 [Kofleriaceae bacterium]
MAAPDALLSKLVLGVETPAGKVRGLGPAIPALLAAGWVTARKDGRAWLVTLTEAGAVEAARLAAAAPAPKAKAAGKPKARTAAAIVAELDAKIADLTARVAVLEARTQGPAPAPAPGPAPAQGPVPAQDPAALRAQIVAAIGELDARDRLGGLVPIPDLRAELRRRGVTATDGEVTGALEELERAWTIDLSVAQSPSAVAERSAGIERAGRGLLYYVARR